ncbi:MAG: low molecular weight phosphotyrosine protein phosphatase [Prolixibacteraceae bacterium]|nr:low molecular weight phosphotyrosine protein phosphatase [Prolixibacteraceae bacterium]
MKKRVLFVCMGNICRSPSAEAVFRKLVDDSGLKHAIECDSAGTIGYHSGEPADSRMRKHASKRGYKLDSISRKFNPFTDFDTFDYIIGMDNDNISDLERMARGNHDLEKIYRMTDFSPDHIGRPVPDPYYGGDDGFELVLDLLEDTCEGLLNAIRKETD